MRAAFAAVALAFGLKVTGVMAATTISTAVALFIPFIALRSWLYREPAPSNAVSRDEVVAYLVPVLVGVLAITSLSTIDVLFAKSVFSSETAGLYGGASLVGRVILYLPSAIVFVLLPKVSARHAIGRDATDVLGKSLIVTVGFCITGIALYAVVPDLILFVAFGSRYEDAASLLWLFAVAMTAYAVMNVLLAYHLGRGESRCSWLLLVGALVQIAAFTLLHGSPRELLAADITIALGLVAAHEVLVDDAFRRLARRWLGKPHFADV
jgi:O-antigen/teichoic acid export membrane protein